MPLDDDWETVRYGKSVSLKDSGVGMLRIALIFGSAAVALTLVLTPLAENRASKMARSGEFGIDATTTGSTNYTGQYTIRRSILQNERDSICILRDNGTRSGDC